jgi:hypothetical protein
MTSTNAEKPIGGYRQEVDIQKLGPALLIASSLVLAIRTAKWSPTHSDGLATVDWDKEVEHSARVAKIAQHCSSIYHAKPSWDLPGKGNFQRTDSPVRDGKRVGDSASPNSITGCKQR